MGKDKLRKFKENETFRCLVQPATSEVLNCDQKIPAPQLRQSAAGGFGPFRIVSGDRR